LIDAWGAFPLHKWLLGPVDNLRARSRVRRRLALVIIPATPHLGTELGLSSRALKRDYTRVYRDVYVLKGAEMTAVDKAVAAWLWSGRTATMAGVSAAALMGSKWVDVKHPAEMFRRNGKPVKGIVIHRDELLPDEHRCLGRIRVSTPARTVFDVGRRPGRTLAVIRADALANATGVRPASVETLMERHPGVRGLVHLREVVGVMDGGAESPQETRTRLLLIDAGLPRPQTQIRVDNWRVDMGYPEFKVGVEYDGEQHWTTPPNTRVTSTAWPVCWPEGG
jgi:hypothetical protein